MTAQADAAAVARELWTTLLTGKDENSGLPYIGVNPDEDTPTLDYDEQAIFNLFALALQSFADAREAAILDDLRTTLPIFRGCHQHTYTNDDCSKCRERNACVQDILAMLRARAAERRPPTTPLTRGADV